MAAAQTTFWNELVDQLTADIRADLETRSEADRQTASTRASANASIQPDLIKRVFDLRSGQPFRPNLEHARGRERSHWTQKFGTTTSRSKTRPRPTDTPSDNQSEKRNLHATVGREAESAKTGEIWDTYQSAEAVAILEQLGRMGAKISTRIRLDATAIERRSLHRERVRMLMRLHPDHSGIQASSATLQTAIELFRALAALKL